MGWFSILPDHLANFELWIIRLFLLLAFVTFGPWLLILLYDLVLYAWRSVTYEFPGIGGRARGRQRPRAPSLTARPDGHKRSFSLASLPRRSSETAEDLQTPASLKRMSNPVVPRTTYEQAGEGG